jgi:hypothetical protein
MLPGVAGNPKDMWSKFRTWLSGWLERFEPQPPPSRFKRPKPESPYHSVSIRPGAVSCQAAKQLGRIRFLSGTVPRLPLPECDCPSCECSYSHYADRRSGFDRRRVIAAPSVTSVERRLTRGRRSKDAQGFDDPQNTR